MKKIITYIVLMVALSSSLFATTGRETDSLALVALYDSANGSGWKTNGGWKSASSLENWFGITMKNGRVSKVELGGDRLSGTIPPEIGNLDSLIILNLSYDTLHGSIPTEIGNLKQLSLLNLSNNQLTGAIPAELGNLTNLSNLYLNDNLLSGNIPESIANIVNLNYLYLYRNNLVGSIPAQFNNLTKMRCLNLAFNKLEGDVPIQSLTNLKYLTINDNLLSGLPALPDTALTSVNIINNRFTFEDIEPYADVQYANYSPQDSVCESIDTMVVIGSKLKFSVNVGGSANHYQWFKGHFMMVNDTNMTLTIPSFSESDAGLYFCKITNTIANKLNLYSRKIRVRVDNGGTIPLKSIYEVQYVDKPQINDSSQYVGQTVKVKGLVLTNPRALNLGARWGVYITDRDNPVSPWTSIFVIQHDTSSSKTNFEDLRVGDFVSFVGTVEEHNGGTQLKLTASNAEAINVISSNNTIPSPKELELSNLLSDTDAESWEDAFIKVNELTVLDTANAYQMLPVKDSGGKQCYLDDHFRWFKEKLIEGTYHWPSKDMGLNVVGIFRQFNAGDGTPIYTINPRRGVDIQLLTSSGNFRKELESSAVKDGGDSRGVVWADFNNDGNIDLFVLNRADHANFYYINDGNSLIRQTEGDITFRKSFSRAATAGDYDNDGDVDLFITTSNDEHNELWINNGYGNFTLSTTGELFSLQTRSNGVSWGDLDNDGFLDLYITNYDSKNLLFKNNGDGTFNKFSELLPINESNKSLSVNLIDTENDGDLDIFVTNMSGQPDRLYFNDPVSGNLSFVSASKPFSSNLYDSRGTCWADFDNDGDLDIFVTNANQPNILYRNNGDNNFEKVTIGGAIINDNENSTGCIAEDFDNDGLIDIYVLNMGRNSLYKNVGDFSFKKSINNVLTADTSYSMGGACADFNNDGFVDIFVGNAAQKNDFYINNGNANHWLKVKCEGIQSNRSGIGAKVLLKTGSIWQMRQINGQSGYLSQSGLTARFGLGSATTVDSLKIIWPSGVVWDTANVASNQQLKIVEPVDSKPTINTYDAVNITNEGAELKGGIFTKNEKVVEAFFAYGEDHSLNLKTVNILSNPILENKAVNTLVYQVHDLLDETTYYFRLIAVTESNDTTWGVEKSFTTLTSGAGGAPSALTKNVSDIMPRSAKVEGEVNVGSNTEMTVSFKYSTDINLMSGNKTIEADPGTVSGATTITCNAVIGGLDPNTTYYYQVMLMDSSFTTTTGGIKSFTTALYAQNVSLSYTANFPDKKNEDYAASDFRLFGIPGNNTFDLSAILGNSFDDWAAYWDNGADKDFLVKYNGGEKFKCIAGRGFWVLNRGDFHISANIENPSLNNNSEVEVLVHNGWNIITNPFADPISWSDVRDAKSNSNITDLSDLWQFDGSFSTTNTINSYVGYYIHTNASQINFPYKPNSSKKIAKSLAKNSNNGWVMNIALNSGDYTDESTYLGVAEDADVNFDGYDKMKPHAVGEILNIYFEHPEWEMAGNVFASDIRSKFDEMEKWDFTVNVAKGESAELTFRGMEIIPEDFSIYLIDRTRSKIYNLREEGNYQYTANLKLESFTVLIGKEELLQNELASVVPLEFKVENNFPNPFNPETTIPVQVPKKSEIAIDIFNILGEKVLTLFNGKLAAGRHLFTWHAGKVPSGIYFYRISSSTLGKSLTGKMILMK